MLTHYLENLQILIVEDDLSLRIALRRHLGVTHDVTEAGSVAQAIDLIQNKPKPEYDVMLLDQGLPDGYGLDLMGPLLGHSPKAAVIILTGDGHFRLVQEALKRGAHDFLVKSDSILEEITLRLPIALAHAQAKQISPGQLTQAAVLLPSPKTPANGETYSKFMDLCERTYLNQAIESHNGKLALTAQNLGLARGTLWKKMSTLGLKEEQ
jgi:DNA-binding NtrC family response regulator